MTTSASAVRRADSRQEFVREIAEILPEHGEFGRGSAATSALLADFTVSVDATLDAN